MTLDLLRLTTAGSVDDGKSTLIGRLLYDSKQIFEDQLENVAAGERAPRRRGHARPRAAHRRPAGRARAGHHDRCRLPLLRDAAAALHHRRLPGAPPVHAQHGHRRLHGRPRGRADRRPPGRARAVQAPRLHQRAAGHPQAGRGGQQDGPGRALAGALRGAGRGIRGLRRHPAPRRAQGGPSVRDHLHPDLGAARRQRRRPLRDDGLV